MGFSHLKNLITGNVKHGGKSATLWIYIKTRVIQILNIKEELIKKQTAETLIRFIPTGC